MITNGVYKRRGEEEEEDQQTETINLLTLLGSTRTKSNRGSRLNEIVVRKASSLALLIFIQKLILVTRPTVSEGVEAPVDVLHKTNGFIYFNINKYSPLLKMH